MMSTVLRISGPYEQLRQSMLEAPFEFVESVASRKERERGESPDDGTATFNFTVSESNGDRVPAQIKESALFLSENAETLSEIRKLPGVDCLCLDFSWYFPRTSAGQYNRLPHSLLRICATLGIDIEVSVYRVRR